MIEAGLQLFVNYYIVFTIVIGFLFRKSYFHTPQRFFFYVLVALGVVDHLGGILVATGKFQLLYLNYNIGVILHILGFIYYYYLIVNDEGVRKTIYWISLTYLVSCILSFLFYKNVYSSFNGVNYMTGSICLTAVIVMFFRKILNTEFVLSLKKFLWFWVSLGLIFFYVPVIPILVSEGLNLEELRTSIEIVKLGLNVVMYTVFNIGLIFSEKEYNATAL